MKHEEIAESLVFAGAAAVVFIGERRIECLVGKQATQLFDSRFDELDARGFQWFEKSPREPQSHAIAVPELAAVPGRKSQEVRLGLALAFEIVDERSGGLVVTEMAAAIDIAVSNTMPGGCATASLRRAPLPVYKE